MQQKSPRDIVLKARITPKKGEAKGPQRFHGEVSVHFKMETETGVVEQSGVPFECDVPSEEAAARLLAAYLMRKTQ